MKFPVIALLACFSISVSAQWLSTPNPGVPRLADGSPDMNAPAPQTEWGKPDLSGLWVATSVSGDLPYSDKFMDWVEQTQERHAESFYSLQPRYNCLPSGPQYLTAGTTSTGLRRFVQSEQMVSILHEDMVHRLIYMDGRQLEEDPLPTWMGYSVGRWEGDTLVVESNGYNDRTWLDRRGAVHTDQLTITERYTRENFGSMQLDVTYLDPGAFHEPLQVSIQLQNQADNELLEYVCNETAQLGSKWEGDFQQAQSTAIEVDPDILEGYVGTYEGVWLGNVITLEFWVEDEKLRLLRNGVEVRLVAQSDIAFDGSNGFGFVFNELDEDGRALSVDEIHVSGGWPFPRIE